MKLLLIEDDAIDQYALERRVEGVTWIANSAEQALALLRLEEVEAPLIILLDLHLSRDGLTGLELLRLLRREREFAWLDETPIFVMSSSDDPDTIKEVREAGAAGYYLKTASGKRLGEFIAKLERRWSAMLSEAS